MTEKMNQDPAWTYDTICRGIVTQFDVPGILREMFDAHETPQKVAREVGGVTPARLLMIARGELNMGQSVGRRFIDYLEDWHKKRAVSAAADAAQGSEAAEQETSPDIAAQIQEELNEMKEQPSKLGNLQSGPETTRLEELEQQNADLRSALDEIGQEADRLRKENDEMSVRIARLEADNAGCGPMRVDDLETQLEAAQREHVVDLETIRDLVRRELRMKNA